MTAEIAGGFDTLAQAMRKLMVVLTLVLGLACSSTKATEGPADMRILASGTQAIGSPAEQRTVLATDDATFRSQWSSLIGSESVPQVDFNTEVAVIFLAGQRNTGGYRVVAESARVEGEELVVRAPVHSPGARAIVTQVITSPYVVVAVKARAVKSVRWEK